MTTSTDARVADCSMSRKKKFFEEKNSLEELVKKIESAIISVWRLSAGVYADSILEQTLSIQSCKSGRALRADLSRSLMKVSGRIRAQNAEYTNIQFFF